MDNVNDVNDLIDLNTRPAKKMIACLPCRTAVSKNSWYRHVRSVKHLEAEILHQSPGGEESEPAEPVSLLKAALGIITTPPGKTDQTPHRHHHDVRPQGNEGVGCATRTKPGVAPSGGDGRPRTKTDRADGDNERVIRFYSQENVFVTYRHQTLAFTCTDRLVEILNENVRHGPTTFSTGLHMGFVTVAGRPPDCDRSFTMWTDSAVVEDSDDVTAYCKALRDGFLRRIHTSQFLPNAYRIRYMTVAINRRTPGVTYPIAPHPDDRQKQSPLPSPSCELLEHAAACETAGGCEGFGISCASAKAALTHYTFCPTSFWGACDVCSDLRGHVDETHTPSCTAAGTCRVPLCMNNGDCKVVRLRLVHVMGLEPTPQRHSVLCKLISANPLTSKEFFSEQRKSPRTPTPYTGQ